MLLKLALVPLVVWLASLAGRRWGHAVTGWISGLPLIAGPISVFLALDLGDGFAASTAAWTLQVTGASALHCFVFAHVARRFRWAVSLLFAWAAFFSAAAALGAFALPPLAGLALTALLLAVMLAGLPKVPPLAGPAAIPGAELAVRVGSALALAAAVTLGASFFGPRLSGILLTFPITGSVLPAFTLALHGSAPTTRLLAGFLSGLYAFAVFHFVVAAALPAFGPLPTYVAAVTAALVATAVVMKVQGRMRAMGSR